MDYLSLALVVGHLSVLKVDLVSLREAQDRAAYPLAVDTNSEQPRAAVKARQVAPPWSIVDRYETV